MKQMIVTRAMMLINTSASDADISLKCEQDAATLLRVSTCAMLAIHETNRVKKSHVNIFAKHARRALKMMEQSND